MHIHKSPKPRSSNTSLHCIPRKRVHKRITQLHSPTLIPFQHSRLSTITPHSTARPQSTQTASIFSNSKSTNRKQPSSSKSSQYSEIGSTTDPDPNTTYARRKLAQLPRIDPQLAPWSKTIKPPHTSRSETLSTTWVDHIDSLTSPSATQPTELNFTSPIPLRNDNISLLNTLTRRIPRINHRNLSADKLVQRFMNWLIDNGAVIDHRIAFGPISTISQQNITTPHSDTHCTGTAANYAADWTVYATADIPPNTPLIVIPHALTITPFKPFVNLLEGTVVRPEHCPLITRNSTNQFELIYRLFYEFCAFETSPFKPYLDILPKYVPTSTTGWPEVVSKEYLDISSNYHIPLIIPAHLLTRIPKPRNQPQKNSVAKLDRLDTILHELIQIFQVSQKDHPSFHPLPVPSTIPDEQDLSKLPQNIPDKDIRLLTHAEMQAIQEKQILDYKKSLHQTRPVEYLAHAFSSEPLTLPRAATLYNLVQTRAIKGQSDLRMIPLIDSISPSNDPNCETLEINYGDTVVPNPEAIARHSPTDPSNHFSKATLLCSTERIKQGQQLSLQLGKQAYTSTTYKTPEAPLNESTAAEYKKQLLTLQTELLPSHLLPDSLLPSSQQSSDHATHEQNAKENWQHKISNNPTQNTTNSIQTPTTPPKPKSSLLDLFSSLFSSETNPDSDTIKHKNNKDLINSHRYSHILPANLTSDDFSLHLSHQDISSTPSNNTFHVPENYNYTSSPLNHLLQQSSIRFPYLSNQSFKTPPTHNFTTTVSKALNLDLASHYPATEYKEVRVHITNPVIHYDLAKHDDLSEFHIRKKPVETDPYFVKLLQYYPQELILEQIVTNAKQFYVETTQKASFSPICLSPLSTDENVEILKNARIHSTGMGGKQPQQQHHTKKAASTVNFKSFLEPPSSHIEMNNFYSSFQFSLNHVSKPLESFLYLLALETLAQDNFQIGVSTTDQARDYNVNLQKRLENFRNHTDQDENKRDTEFAKLKIHSMTVLNSPQYTAAKLALKSNIYESTVSNSGVNVRRPERDQFYFINSFAPLHFTAQYMFLGLVSTMIQHAMPNSTVFAASDHSACRDPLQNNSNTNPSSKSNHTQTKPYQVPSPLSSSRLKSIQRHNSYAKQVQLDRSIHATFTDMQEYREKRYKSLIRTDASFIHPIKPLPIDLSPKEQLHSDEVMFAAAQLLNKTPLYTLQHMFNAIATVVGVENRFWNFDAEMGSITDSNTGETKTTLYQAVGHPYQNHTTDPRPLVAQPQVVSNMVEIPTVHNTDRSSAQDMKKNRKTRGIDHHF